MCGFQFLWDSLEIMSNFQSYLDFAALSKSFQEQTQSPTKDQSHPAAADAAVVRLFGTELLTV
jgi:hypothetical protein